MDEIFSKYLLIPIVTAVLTTGAVYLKDLFIESKKKKKELEEKQILELYNKLFIIFLKYNHKLRISWQEEVIDLPEDDSPEKFRELVVDNVEIWNEVYKEVSDLVHDKIHLLNYDDLKLWYEVEYYYNWVETEGDLYEAFNAFKKFIKHTVDTYGRLYHEYHLATKSRKKAKKKEIKQKIKNVRSNPFYSDEERKKEIDKLDKELKNLDKK
ncbi:hypothetical protein ACPT9H_00340 [Brevibacillus borstelensis]|uniref:hypothetical protein n=1 Tax=Brevibacillus borstelensis TaxID=45462 RepID=UPI003CE59B4C